MSDGFVLSPYLWFDWQTTHLIRAFVVVSEFAVVIPTVPNTSSPTWKVPDTISISTSLGVQNLETLMLSKNGYTLVKDFIPLALNSIFLDLILWMISLLTTLLPKELVGLGNTSLTLFLVPLLLCWRSTPTDPPTVVVNDVGPVTSTAKLLGITPPLWARASLPACPPPLNKLSNSLAVTSLFLASLIVFAPSSTSLLTSRSKSTSTLVVSHDPHIIGLTPDLVPSALSLSSTCSADATPSRDPIIVISFTSSWFVSTQTSAVGSSDIVPW